MPESVPSPGWHPDKDQTWVLVAKERLGARASSGLRRAKTRIVLSVGTFKSQEEVLEKAHRRLLFDAEFRKKFSGWTLFAAEVSHLIEVQSDGRGIVRFHNETH